MFCILAVVIIGSAIVCVFTKRIMRAATFLLFVPFGVAGVYFLLDYTFLGTAQIAIYAGGLTMLYIFAIQLVSKRTLQGLQERQRGKTVVAGALVALIGLVTVALVLLKNQFIDMSASMVDAECPCRLSERSSSVQASISTCCLSSSFPYFSWHVSSVE